VLDSKPGLSTRKTNRPLIAPQGVAEAAQAAKMSPDDKAMFEKHGYNRFECAFHNRVFYIYQCAGRDHHNKQRAAKVHAVVRVIDMSLSLARGYEISLLNETTNQKQAVGAIPAKLFDFPIFVSVPCSFAAKQNLVTGPNGEVHWDPVLGLYVKAANKADFYSNKNFYAETPKRMGELYPEQDWRPDLHA